MRHLITVLAATCLFSGCNFGDFNADIDAIFNPGTIRVPTIPCPVCDTTMPVIEMKYGTKIAYCRQCAFLFVKPGEAELPKAEEPKPVPRLNPRLDPEEWEYEALIPQPKVWMLGGSK